MRYSCLAPGKRLRPAMLMASYEAVAKSHYGPSALDAGCAVEMVHCFSLIHDDLPAIDDDDLRRGRPTCHKVYGEAMAILAGDALFALAFSTLAAPLPDASSEARVFALGTLARASGSDGLVGGEVADVLAEGKAASPDDVEWIHVRKTGALFAASCAIGAALGGADPDLVQRFHRYGLDIGLAFQIADDLLNETATPEQLGKAAGSDRARGKATYPSIHGIPAARKESERLVEDAREAIRGSLSPELAALARFALERTW